MLLLSRMPAWLNLRAVGSLSADIVGNKFFWAVNGASGSDITSSLGIVKNLVVQKDYSIAKKDEWNVANMHALVWVVNKTTKEVVQVKEASLR